jgi:hypothetical protein
MNRRNLLGLLITILMITSGPIYLPLAIATVNVTETNSTQPFSDPLNQTDTTPTETDYTILYNYTYQDPPNQTYTPEQPTQIDFPLIDRPPVTKPNTQLSLSTYTGTEPIKVTLEATYEPLKDWTPLVYNWDFDGDGVNEYSSFTNTATKIYSFEKQKYNPVVTIKFTNGYTTTATTEITIEPREWLHEYQNYHTYIKVDKQGNTYIFDQNNLIPISLIKDNTPLQTPDSANDSTWETNLLYQTTDTNIQVNIRYGLTGRAYFEVIETLKPEAQSTIDQITPIKVPETVKIGRLSLTETKIVEDENTRTIVFDAGNTDPWKDQGLTPYGDYFKNLNEFVSMQTGYITVIQTDLIVPGRGLDLVFKRVLAPPSEFYQNQPASTVSYRYQSYPWIPMGNGVGAGAAMD